MCLLSDERNRIVCLLREIWNRFEKLGNLKINGFGAMAVVINTFFSKGMKIVVAVVVLLLYVDGNVQMVS